MPHPHATQTTGEQASSGGGPAVSVSATRWCQADPLGSGVADGGLKEKAQEIVLPGPGRVSTGDGLGRRSGYRLAIQQCSSGGASTRQNESCRFSEYGPETRGLARVIDRR